jgi:hypothetical protein
MKAPEVRPAMPMAVIKAFVAGKCKGPLDAFSLSLSTIFAFAADLLAY